MTETSSYLCLTELTRLEIPAIKGSRFIATGIPFENLEQLSTCLELVKQCYPDANHHCWAFQLSDRITSRVNDDGEPSGSAGKPILAPLTGRHVYNSLVVVTRYFGGVKLGVGGLVRAYSKASNSLLDTAKLIRVQPKTQLNIVFSYEDTHAINAILSEFNIASFDQHYTDNVTISISLDNHLVELFTSKLINLTSNRASIEQVK